jgi:hypothetical protein
MSETVATKAKTNLRKFQFDLIIPIFINTSEWLVKVLKENNCHDMTPSIQLKNLNLHVYRESESFEKAVASAKKDVKKTLESFGFSDMKMLVISYEN